MKICVNTGSYRNAEILTALEVLAKFGITELEFNLRPVMDEGISPDKILKNLETNNQKVVVAAGGWCDFYTSGNAQNINYNSIKRQVELAKIFGTDKIRIFLGLLPAKYKNENTMELVTENLRRIGESFPDIQFLIENHDSLSLDIKFMEKLFENLQGLNFALNFDAVNFERNSVDSNEAFLNLKKYIRHIHVKGLKEKKLWSYSESEYNFSNVFKMLLKAKYTGYISLEYEADKEITTSLLKDYKKLKNDINEILTTEQM